MLFFYPQQTLFSKSSSSYCLYPCPHCGEDGGKILPEMCCLKARHHLSFCLLVSTFVQTKDRIRLNVAKVIGNSGQTFITMSFSFSLFPSLHVHSMERAGQNVGQGNRQKQLNVTKLHSVSLSHSLSTAYRGQDRMLPGH